MSICTFMANMLVVAKIISVHYEFSRNKRSSCTQEQMDKISQRTHTIPHKLKTPLLPEVKKKEKRFVAHCSQTPYNAREKCYSCTRCSL